MTILKNILLIVLPFVLIIAIASISFGLQSLSAITFEIAPEILSLVNEPTVAKFFDTRWKEVFPVKDLIMCLEYDRFPFVLKARQCSEDIFEITRVDLH